MRLSFIWTFLFLSTYTYSHIPALQELSLDEKIGQLMMIATVSSSEHNHEFMHASPYTLDQSYAERMIREYHIGGVIFLGAGTPQEQVKTTQRLQAFSKYPLLMGLDAEWGLSMRHQEDVVHFPRAMTLGALAPQDDDLIYELGAEIGRQCRQLGVHINFAPVADVNSNPRNPIINTRSFGACPKKVAHKSELFMRGMQSAGILACAKHFPGHGDTHIDTHHGRAVITHSQERLGAVELVPFKQLINAGVDAIMTAHLDVPALCCDEIVPATVSHEIITTLLREQMGFHGLIITDGLGMKGVTNDFKPGELELKALKAGNDILLCPVDVARAIARIKQAVREGELLETDIDAHVARILHAKQKVITQSNTVCDEKSLITLHAHDLKERLYRAAVTLVRDTNQILPLAGDNELVVHTFGKADCFVKTLRKYTNITHISSGLTDSHDDHAYNFDDMDLIVVSLHLENRSGMIEMHSEKENPVSAVSFIKKYAHKIVLVLFGNPYNLEHFCDVPTVIVGYENEPEAQQAAAQALLGLYTARGVIPVTPSGITR